jgi:copper chaperone CopZ
MQKADMALVAISGMGCKNCATRVSNSLLNLEGVYEVQVFLNMAMAEVAFDAQQVSTRMLLDAIERAGNDGRHSYQGRLISIT